jgi:hypothetical protein
LRQVCLCYFGLSKDKGTPWYQQTPGYETVMRAAGFGDVGPT